MRAFLFSLAFVLSGIALNTAAHAVTFPYTEEFTLDTANWTGPGSSTALAHGTPGGADGGGFVQHASASEAGVFMTDFGAIVFRANSSANASGGAFTGDWLSAGVHRVEAYMKHDYEFAPAESFLRITGPAGTAAIFFADSNVPVGDGWTLLRYEISESSFVFAGNGTFNGVMGSVGNLTIGVRLPADVDHATEPVTFALDQVSLVPEPSAFVLALATAWCGLTWRPRRDRSSA